MAGRASAWREPFPAKTVPGETGERPLDALRAVVDTERFTNRGGAPAGAVARSKAAEGGAATIS
jgi:hypothetical protein